MDVQLSSLDNISNLPSSIIEDILCLLPIKEAARTSILSKGWRYKWIKIPELYFNENSFGMSTDDSQLSGYEQRFKMKRCKFFFAVYQVLFVHQGPILDFNLALYGDETSYEIDLIINQLSRMNTVKKFELVLFESNGYKLPLSIFSLRQLTHLYLTSLHICHQPPFHVYSNLTNLFLSDVTIPSKTLLHLLSSCPLLKNLTLLLNEEEDILGEKSTFMELFKCLSVLENLTTWTRLTECFDLGPVPRELPASLVNLKFLYVEQMYFCNDLGLPFLILLIKSSPNLVELQLEIPGDSETYLVDENSVTLDENSDIWLGQLTELKLDGFFNLKLLLDFVKFILSRSPMLKKVSIRHHDVVTKDEESYIWKVLLSSPRASPVVEIMVKC